MIKNTTYKFLGKYLFITLSFVSISACSSKLAENNPTGLWMGKLDVEQGSCPTDRPASLRIDKKVILFSPNNSALILNGTFHKKERPRHFVATLHRIDMDHKPYDLIFDAKAEGEHIVGTYGTPDCRARVTFSRPNKYGITDAVAH